MKKQLSIILVLIFLLFLIVKSGRYADIHLKENPKVITFESFLPEKVGMNSSVLSKIDSIVKLGLSANAYPGCQVLVLKDGKAVYEKCFGNYTYESSQKVELNTMYDLASLSKTSGTLLAIMKLYDNGQIKITDKASKYLSFLRNTDKENITISELLFHESGLPATLPFYSLALEKNSHLADSLFLKDSLHYVKTGSKALKFKQDWVSRIPLSEFPSQVSDNLYVNQNFHQAAMQMIAKTKLNAKSYLYSCVNFILLKEIVETISKMQMNSYLDSTFYYPLGLKNIAYLPLRTHYKEEIAPTLKKDFLRNGTIHGFVHDPDAAFLGGVAGNAGLFANARDVATLYQMLLNNGELNGHRLLSENTCKYFTTTVSASGRRGLGFDKAFPINPKHNPCCNIAPSAVYGHTGYTGTCCWVDPINKTIFVFLSNRTYPNDGVNKLAKMGIRSKIQEVIYQSLLP